jgi:hypothetical protein
MKQHTIAVDSLDLHALTATGSLRFPFDGGELELHTGSPQWHGYGHTVEVTDEHLATLREHGWVDFLTGFGRVVLSLETEAVAR